jgi:hypothetical protein
MSPRRRALFALAVKRASSGAMAIVSFVIAGLTVLVCLVLAALARRSGASLERLPMATAWLLAWGAGILVAFSSSARALNRDRDEGIVELLRAHGHTRGAYVMARVVSLALVLLVVVGGGALVVGVSCSLLAIGPHHVVRTLQGVLAASVYSVCFSVMVAPIAFAALGARSRAGGYLWLAGILVVPAMLSSLTSKLVPDGWESLVSVPGALDAVRSALAPPGMDPLGLVRALVAIAIVSAIALAIVRAEAARVEPVR